MVLCVGLNLRLLSLSLSLSRSLLHSARLGSQHALRLGYEGGVSVRPGAASRGRAGSGRRAGVDVALPPHHRARLQPPTRRRWRQRRWAAPFRRFSSRRQSHQRWAGRRLPRGPHGCNRGEYCPTVSSMLLTAGEGLSTAHLYHVARGVYSRPIPLTRPTSSGYFLKWREYVPQISPFS